MRTPKPDRYPPHRQFCRRLLPAIAALLFLRFSLAVYADTLTTLHNFAGPDGADPYGGVIQASDGNFYGTTAVGGNNNSGTVFKLTPSGSFTTLYSLSSADGVLPLAGVIQARDGALYVRLSVAAPDQLYLGSRSLAFLLLSTASPTPKETFSMRA